MDIARSYSHSTDVCFQNLGWAVHFSFIFFGLCTVTFSVWGWGVGGGGWGMCLLGWMVRGQNKAKEAENWLANLGLHEGMLGMLLTKKKIFPLISY